MEDFPTAIIGMFIGLILGGIIVGTTFSVESIDSMNRALSCMSAGNTVAQCQDILGISK